jgi:hypothetical protein
MSVTLDWTSVPYVRRGKIVNSDGGDSYSKKYTRGYGGAYIGVWMSAFVVSLESGGRFCVSAFGRNWNLSRREDDFTFNLVCKETLRILYLH